MKRGLTWFNVTALVAGFTFLYIPLVLLVLFSFNEVRSVTDFTGFSLRWYERLFDNDQLLRAALVTVQLGLASAALATVLGVMAALALVRGGRFRGRTAFAGMVYAPMVMPEVILGLAFLLFFVATSLERGFVTLLLAHVTFTMCFVAVTVQSRLLAFDRSLEEAAQDLGCPPWKSFFLITLPIIAPAVAAGFLLALTLSLDDLVISSFASGPGYTTLPMRIYSSVRLGVTPEINALCTVLIGLVTVGVIVASLVQKRSIDLARRHARP
jgi:putrescine transport system permease protein